jgi:hypothetical protein
MMRSSFLDTFVSFIDDRVLLEATLSMEILNTFQMKWD